jgi:hypothetical protein
MRQRASREVGISPDGFLGNGRDRAQHTALHPEGLRHVIDQYLRLAPCWWELLAWSVTTGVLPFRLLNPRPERGGVLPDGI